MILTGKAKEDFLTMLSILTEIKDKNNLEEYFSKISHLIKNTYYLYFFDIEGICIDRNCIERKMVITDFRDTSEEQTTIDCNYLEFPKEWWEEAIKKANEIYNEKFAYRNTQ